MDIFVKMHVNYVGTYSIISVTSLSLIGIGSTMSLSISVLSIRLLSIRLLRIRLPIRLPFAE